MGGGVVEGEERSNSLSTERLLRFIQELLASLDEARALDVLSRELIALVNAELVAVYVADEAGRLELAAVARSDNGGDVAHLGSMRRLAERALSCSASVRAGVEDLSELWSPGRPAGESIALPLISKGRTLGILALTTSEGDFVAVDPAILATLAEVAASSLDNARLLENAHREARRDALTGLGNQRAFGEHLDSILANPFLSSLTREVSLVLFDLDDFKQVNDRFGHPFGDLILQDVSRAVLRAARTNDEVFRVGGEEFALVVDGGLDAGARVAERARQALLRHRRPRALPTLSAGVASFPRGSSSKEELIAEADRALYAAKRAGKNRVVVCSEERWPSGMPEPSAAKD